VLDLTGKSVGLEPFTQGVPAAGIRDELEAIDCPHFDRGGHDAMVLPLENFVGRDQTVPAGFRQGMAGIGRDLHDTADGAGAGTGRPAAAAVDAAACAAPAAA